MKDTIGRNNRKLPDYTCPECGNIFRPLRIGSKYCSRHCMYKNNGKNKKIKIESWWKNSNGYIEGRICLSDRTQIRVKQHRFVMEGIIGRSLLPIEDVHHINGIKTDNRPENLEIIYHGEHSKISNISRLYKKGYKLNLSEEERKARSLRAISNQLDKMGRDAIARQKVKHESK